MVTSLIVGAAIPLWDRELLSALLAAAQDAERDLPVCRMAVMNNDGTVYRRVIADGHKEFVMLPRCFEIRTRDCAVRASTVTLLRTSEAAHVYVLGAAFVR